MENLRWPVIVITAIIALALWGGGSYYHRYYVKETPLLEQLSEMEEIGEAGLHREDGEAILRIKPSPGYRGPLPDFYCRVEGLAQEELKEPVRVIFEDRPNQRLELFAREVSPALYEGARRGNYRQVAESIKLLAEKHRLTEREFAVDSHRLYLQVWDGDYCLYLVVKVEEAKGGESDA